MEDIYKKAIDKWGNGSQIMMAIEECAEFIKAASKLGREINGSTIDDVCSEIADVEIMMEQMRIIFPESAIDKYKEEKLKRLADRLGEELP